MRAGRRNVRITHPDKALFPDGITKADLADYYRDVAPAMLPHVRDRPISMPARRAPIISCNMPAIRKMSPKRMPSSCAN